MMAAANPVLTTAMNVNRTPCTAEFHGLLLPGVPPRLGTLSSMTATADLLHAAAVRQKVRATWSRRIRASALVFDDDEDGEDDGGDEVDGDDGDDDELSVPRPRASSREEMTE